MEFRKAYLESLPLDDDSVDLVLSNCVLNLSRNKRRTFAEIFRVLKPGGRLVVSDVVCESEPDHLIRNDETLHGECIAGALTQRDLFGLLEETGFAGSRVMKRFPYRVVRDHPFFSMTFEAQKPREKKLRRVMYRGPFAAVVTRDGTLLTPGVTCELPLDRSLDGSLDCFELDGDGNVTNAEIGESACCVLPGREVSAATGAGSCCAGGGECKEDRAEQGSCCGSGKTDAQESAPAPLLTIGPPASPAEEKHGQDCMLCGTPLVYFIEERDARCEYCAQPFRTTALCERGHFVCDRCHAEDGLALIEEICATTDETDLLALMQEIRRHRSIPLHGPEHHAMVPGVILATYRNLGGELTLEAMRTGIRRGSKVAGGSCGFAGSCGAAIGVGIAFSVILEGTPLTPAPRASAMRATSEVLAEVSRTEAPRCCQRESYVALKKAAELSRELLPLPLRAEAAMRCRQMSLNADCIGPSCPLIQDLISAKHGI